MTQIPKTIPAMAQGSLAQSELYLLQQSYLENYQNGPRFSGSFPILADYGCPSKLKYSLFDAPLINPLGVPAGPLLNSKWVQFYLKFGFAVPTYKTVRSIAKETAPYPHCAYIAMPTTQTALALGQALPELQSSSNAPNSSQPLSIANSFGVPSVAPEVWMADVELANSYCCDGQLLIVSIIGTEGAQGRNLRKDFGYTAALACEADAKVIEANLSCPNLSGNQRNRVAGMLYIDAENACCIAKEIRQAIGKHKPLLLKIGYLEPEQLKAFVAATRPYVDGYTAINTLRANVRQSDGTLAFPSRLKVGISGYAIRHFARNVTLNLEVLRQQRQDDFAIVSVGGVNSAEDLEQRLQDGANLAMSATAAMWDPYLALRWQIGKSTA